MAKEKFEWETEVHYPVDYSFDEKHRKAWEEDIVETAGFIPLEVRFKQMEQAGYRARFLETEFSSHDVSDMYLKHPEFDITPEDSIEEMIEKMELRAAYIQSVKDDVRARNAATDTKTVENEVKNSRSESAADAAEQN